MFYHNQGYGKKDILSTEWQGPKEIIQIFGPDAYTLKDISNSLITNRAHTKFIKQFLSKCLGFIYFINLLKKLIIVCIFKKEKYYYY